LFSSEPSPDARIINQLESFAQVSGAWPAKLLVAYSGGLDSSVLLHVLARWRDSLPRLEVCHVHHGLHPQADAWVRHCQSVCDALDLPLHVERLALNPGANNLEQKARQARYQALLKHCASNDWIVTAHHADDQAETVLFRLLRGAGIKGAAGIQGISRREQAMIVRPMLELTRSQLERLAIDWELHWVDDTSNLDERFRRNFLRQRIFPLLHQYWPKASLKIGQFARHADEAVQLLESLAQEDWRETQGTPSTDNQKIDLRALRDLSLPRRKNLLRYWLAGVRLPVSGQQLEQILAQIDTDANAFRLDVGERSLRRSSDCLYVTPKKLPEAMTEILCWQHFPEPLKLPNGLILTAEKSAEGFSPPRGETLLVKPRQGGEVLQPRGRQHANRLKILYQEQGIPAWERNYLPLIWVGDQVAAIPGHFVAEEFYGQGEQTYQLSYQLDRSE